MKFQHLLLPAFLALAACTAIVPPPYQKPIPVMPPGERRSDEELVRAASQPVTCTGMDECTAKWGRALTWVQKNSSYKVMTQTDRLIKTAGPLEPTTDSAFTVTRTEDGVIHFMSNCGHTPLCVPSDLQLKAEFIRFVNSGY